MDGRSAVVDRRHDTPDVIGLPPGDGARLAAGLVPPVGRYTRLVTADESVTEVPYDRLAPDTLRRVCEEFVTRDGTDYGEVELTLDEKVARLLSLLRGGQAKIYFDHRTETVNIVSSGGRLA